MLFIFGPINERIDKCFALKNQYNEKKNVSISRIEPEGDMYQHHIDFVEWAKLYDNGGTNMRSKTKHDEWKIWTW